MVNELDENCGMAWETTVQVTQRCRFTKQVLSWSGYVMSGEKLLNQHVAYYITSVQEHNIPNKQILKKEVQWVVVNNKERSCVEA